MFNPRFLASASLSALVIIALGCGAPNKPAAGGGGTTGKSTDPELNRSLTLKEIEDLKPAKLEANQQEVVAEEISFIAGMLSEDPRISAQAKGQMAGKRILFTGTVLEKSPDGAETPFVVLDGGEHRKKKYTVKCNFAATEAESLKKVNPQDNIQVEGVTDGNVKEQLLEFKECVLKPEKSAVDASDAEKTSEDKSPAARP